MSGLCSIFCPSCVQIAGTGVLGIGLWLRLDPKTKSLFEGENSPYVFYTGQWLFMCVLNTSVVVLCKEMKRVCVSGVYILIAAGALMMVVGFLGCCGAIQESSCMLGLVNHTTCAVACFLFLKILQYYFRIFFVSCVGSCSFSSFCWSYLPSKWLLEFGAFLTSPR